jgi:hypothetical protein
MYFMYICVCVCVFKKNLFCGQILGELYNTTQRSTAKQRNTTQHNKTTQRNTKNTTQHSKTTQHNTIHTAQHKITQHRTKQHGKTHGTTQHKTIQYSTTKYNATYSLVPVFWSRFMWTDLPTVRGVLRRVSEAHRLYSYLTVNTLLLQNCVLLGTYAA